MSLSPVTTTDLDSTGPDWYTKLEPLYSNFIKASHAFQVPGWNVSVDEQLILFKGRSRHAMNMVSKAAGYGFKLYSLCVENYLYSFLFTSKVSKIGLLERIKGLSDSSSVVLQLVKSLPTSIHPIYVVYMDNFFTNVKLYTALKELGIRACGTAKNGSGFPVELLTLREVLTKEWLGKNGLIYCGRGALSGLAGQQYCAVNDNCSLPQRFWSLWLSLQD